MQTPKRSDSRWRTSLLLPIALALLASFGILPLKDPRAAAADPPLLEDPSDDPDLDGLPSAREILLGTDPADPDTDRDGLLDGWEVDGADFDGNGRIDPYEVLAALGADPKRQDVFAEIDWVVLLTGDPIPAGVLDRMLDAVRAALAAGSIAFHADVQAVPSAEILRSTANAASLLEGTHGDSGLLRALLHAVHGDPDIFAPWRRNIFYHVVVTESGSLVPGGADPPPAGSEPAFAERFASADDRAAGFSDFGAMALLLLQDRLLDPGYMAATVLHELGHAFGLGHGGALGPFEWDDRNYKPNYPSVMNYARLLDELAEFSSGLSPAICEGPSLGLGDGCLRDHDDMGKFVRDGFDGIGRNAFRGAEGLCETEQARLVLSRGSGEPPILALRGRGGIALIDGIHGVPRIVARIPARAWPSPWTGDRVFPALLDGEPGIILEGIPAWRAARLEIPAAGEDPGSIAPRILPLDPKTAGIARHPIVPGAFTRRDRTQVFFRAEEGPEAGDSPRFAILEIAEDRAGLVWDAASS
ncbi:MAG: hypothetical protein JXP34_25285, partial [Planctomycetes bacterium]|nr:hypothetical protein [Planctomycetota bacterium]